MKTYACKVLDYVGAEYTVGYFLSSSPAEALERAVRDCGPTAWAVMVDDEDRMIDTIEGLMQAENDYTRQRAVGGK